MTTIGPNCDLLILFFMRISDWVEFNSGHWPQLYPNTTLTQHRQNLPTRDRRSDVLVNSHSPQMYSGISLHKFEKIKG
jgi:hypothetical protein